jgi:hypothetical protein
VAGQESVRRHHRRGRHGGRCGSQRVAAQTFAPAPEEAEQNRRKTGRFMLAGLAFAIAYTILHIWLTSL